MQVAAAVSYAHKRFISLALGLKSCKTFRVCFKFFSVKYLQSFIVSTGFASKVVGSTNKWPGENTNANG